MGKKEFIEEYISGAYKSVGGCVAKAKDAAPFCKNPKGAYKNQRLDYPKSEYTDIAENVNGEIFVLRFTSDKFPTNRKLPNRGNKNGPPCTEAGFTGSDNCLVPEYFYNREKFMITDGAIFMVDQHGNERIVAYFDDRGDSFKFAPV